MPTKRNATGSAREHKSEIYGLLFLAAAVFLTLCLFSYHPLDPSLFTWTEPKRVHNVGGIIGAYAADLLLMLVGYGAYLLPAALAALAVNFFARGRNAEIRLGFKRVLAVLSLVMIASILSQLRIRETGLGDGRIHSGGVLGWWLGGTIREYFGRMAYLILGCGLLLSLLTISRISIVRVLKILRAVSLFLAKKGQSSLGQFLIVGWVRFKQSLAKWWAERGKRFEMKKKAPIVREPVIQKPVTVRVSVPPSLPVQKTVSQPLPTTLPSTLEDQEPKILPRADLKDLKENRKKDQLELVSPVIANYQLPQLSFLDSESQVNVKIDEENLKLNSKLLEQKLKDFGVEGRITEIHPGPVITMYEFEPAAGVKVNKIVNLEDDLSLTMGGKSVRIIAPIPGKAAVGIEIPNNARETVWLKDVIGHNKFQKAESKLTLALGKDTEGIPYVSDLAKMPHLLVAGATGAGKSVSVNSMILSILYKATPEDVRLIMIDPKMLELTNYEGIPHLLLPVITQPRKAAMALNWGIREMERRYELLSQKGSRNIVGYNKIVSKEEKLPYIIIIIDELADLMMTAAKDVETAVTRLAQMARAAGIHLVVATQRPSVDVITGLIKANFPARISFKVSSKHDSRTILDQIGSEHLLGSGDMLFMSGGANGLLRIHGAYVSETEIERVVNHWKSQGKPDLLDESVLKPINEEGEGGAAGGDDLSDDMYDQALALVAESRQASISMIQRRLRIGYNRAARMIERMEKEGVVGPADGAKPREVFVSNFGNQET